MDDEKISQETQEDEDSSSGFLSAIPLPKAGYMMIGFLLIASVSAWLNLKQAKTVDAQGDVLSAQAEISRLNLLVSSNRERLNDPETKPDSKTEIQKEIKAYNDEIEQETRNLADQRQDVKKSSANMLNGSWFWTLLIQIGAAGFGIGVINIILSKKEDSRVRSAAIIIIGAVVIFMLFSRLLNTVAVGILSS